MKKKTRLKYVIPTIAALLTLITIAGFTGSPDLSSRQMSDKTPDIRPDYNGITIPPNIAPMNFNIELQADKYLVHVYCDSDTKIEIKSSTSRIIFPAKPWHNLLKNNKGKTLNIDIYTKTKNNNWIKYKTIKNNIAAENIDPYLFYRKLHPAHFRSRENGPIKVVQQNLTNFKTRDVITGQSYNGGCVNCHSPLNNKTEKITIGVRSSVNGTGTLYIENDKVRKIGTKLGYNSWHPSGKLLVFSVNNIRQFFHSANSEVRDAIDMDSMMAYYLVDSNKIKTPEAFANKDVLETYPGWSPDGKYLYFCKAPLTWKPDDKVPPVGFENVKYDLVRISYNLEKDLWGQVETVISAKDNARSNLLPRISPDGRWLAYCQCNYGCFPAFNQSSDLYLIDLNKPKVDNKFKAEKLSINTDKSQSWHCFSSNSKWLAYSSKQQNGLFTRIYITYIDDEGQSHKSFIVPQKDPLLYDSHLETFSFPELSIEPMKISAEKLAAAVRNRSQIEVDLPVTMASPKKTPSQKSRTSYSENE